MYEGMVTDAILDWSLEFDLPLFISPSNSYSSKLKEEIFCSLTLVTLKLLDNVQSHSFDKC